jgi:hypothetical protein
MPPLLTPTNPTPRRRALEQPQAPSLISVPFPQSSITAPGNGGTALQCPAKRRVILHTAAEQVEEDGCPLHNPLLDQERGTPPPPQHSLTLYPPQLLSGQSPDSVHGGRTFPSPLPRGHLSPWLPGDTSHITHRSGAKEEWQQPTHHQHATPQCSNLSAMLQIQRPSIAGSSPQGRRLHEKDQPQGRVLPCPRSPLSPGLHVLLVGGQDICVPSPQPIGLAGPT